MWDLRRTGRDFVMTYVDPVGVLVGAELANSCRVMLYQHSPGTYVNFGPMGGP
jgi:hypothetical protein